MERTMIESTMITNHILGLSTQLEQLQTALTQIASNSEAVANRANTLERVSRGTSLSMEGIAHKTDENYRFLQAVERSIQQLAETQLDTASLAEGVHQLISDSFLKLQRYLEIKYSAVPALNLDGERKTAQQELATKFIERIDALLNEHTTVVQRSASLKAERRLSASAIKERQTKALSLIEELTTEPTRFQRTFFPVHEKRRRAALVEELSTLIAVLSTGNESGSADSELQQYSDQIDRVHAELIAIRSELLQLWQPAVITTVNDEQLELGMDDLELDFDMSTLANTPYTTDEQSADELTFDEDYSFFGNGEVADEEIADEDDEPEYYTPLDAMTSDIDDLTNDEITEEDDTETANTVTTTNGYHQPVHY